MKFSYQWIQELVPGLQTEAVALGQLITMKTAECDGVERVFGELDKVCLARVVEAEPLPGSSHNRKTIVETGRYGQKTVVCGASNCVAGLITAYVPPGTHLEGREIGVAKIEGVVSEGMLASAADLGLSRDHSGVLEFTGAPGMPLPGIGADSIIEIDNKSLTHRPDLWGHFGMAREVAAITALPLTDPADLTLLPPGPESMRVEIAAPTLCPRYSALVVENVTVQPSPLWLQARLTSIGLNPINNIVDITNFVMAELAQPMHAFDADKLQGGTIVVRTAREGETLAALNGESYTLSGADLVIADAAGAIALAGVIGGADSAISADTKRIVFESANFQASGVRKTSANLKLRTDASMRFEKAQDPVNTTRGLARAVALLQVVSPGCRIVGGVTDIYTPAPVPAPIELSVEWLAAKLGTQISTAEVVRILTSLAFQVEEFAPGMIRVTVPSWRATKDVTIKDDLVEEVGRIIGYGSITPTAPLVAARVPVQLSFRMFLRTVRQSVADQGFTEVYNYSFVNDELIARFQLAKEQHVGVVNPIAADQTLLRTSLLPRIWSNLVENSKQFDDFRLFEVGREIRANGRELPVETPRLIAAVFGTGDGAAGLFELKRLAECLRPGVEVVPTEPRSYEHPSRVAEVRVGDAPLGRLFELHPSLLEHGRAAILEIDLAALQQHSRSIAYQPIRRTPSSSFDLSVMAERRALVGAVQAQMQGFGGELLQSIEFLREYAQPPIPEGQKSVSYRLTLAHPTRTLSSDEVAAIRNQVIEGMRSAGYQLLV